MLKNVKSLIIWIAAFLSIFLGAFFIAPITTTEKVEVSAKYSERFLELKTKEYLTQEERDELVEEERKYRAQLFQELNLEPETVLKDR